MYRFLKYSLSGLVIVLCLSVSLVGYAAVGAEPSTTGSEQEYPAFAPATSVPAYPGMVPGVGETGSSYQPMYPMSPTGTEMTPYTQPYSAPMYYGDMSMQLSPSTPDMSGMMYPSYSPNAPSMYQDPYQQNPWNVPGTGQWPSYPQQVPSYSQQVPSYPQQMQYGSPDQLYNQAMQSYRNRDYWSALAGFRQVATRYPQSDLADNAYYWMGEVYYAWKNFPAAIQSFQTVVYSYPNGNKLPDALVKMGYAYAEIRQYSTARSILNDVASRFSSNSRIRNLAVKKLNELNNVY